MDAPAESHVQAIAAPHQTKPHPAVLYQQAESQPEVKSEAQKPAPSAVEAPEKPIINSGDIIKSWKHLAASLPKSQANLSALLNSVKMIDVQGKTLVLGLASDVLVSKIDKPDQIEIIQKLIKDNSTWNSLSVVRSPTQKGKGRSQLMYRRTAWLPPPSNTAAKSWICRIEHEHRIYKLQTLLCTS
jgi:hypothetical protein